MKDKERVIIERPTPSEMEACRSALKWSLISDILAQWRVNGPISCSAETTIDSDYVEVIGEENGLKVVQDAFLDEMTAILDDVAMIDAEEVYDDTTIAVHACVDYLEDTHEAIFNLSVQRIEH